MPAPMNSWNGFGVPMPPLLYIRWTWGPLGVSEETSDDGFNWTMTRIMGTSPQTSAAMQAGFPVAVKAIPTATSNHYTSSGFVNTGHAPAVVDPATSPNSFRNIGRTSVKPSDGDNDSFAPPVEIG